MMQRNAVAVLVVGALLVTQAPEAWAVDPCQSNCAELTVGSAAGTAGGTVTIPISFQQGPNDAQVDEGNDDVAAIAFTLGIPGIGMETPLSLADCDLDADGLPEAVTVADALANDFKVVVENASCTNRNRCLCPGPGQNQDNFINIVVYGPKELPPEGPVDIPVLPSGELLSVSLRIASGAPENIPLHVFAQTDNQAATPKPSFGALLSIGDRSAIDQTCQGNCVDPDTSQIRITDGAITVSGGCVGDCNGDGNVTVDELVLGVNIALGTANIDACPAFDADGNGSVTVDELIQGVNNALNGCPQ